MQEQMDRMTRVTSEVTELVYLRLGRGVAVDAETDVERDFRCRQAGLLTHAMLGVVRFMALQWIPEYDFPIELDAQAKPPRPPRSLAPTLAESLSETVELLRRTLSIPGL
jgi:hypothetical protein